MKVNREVDDVEDGFVCFACREREEMKGEIGRLRQVVCELVEKLSDVVGRVHSPEVSICTFFMLVLRIFIVLTGLRT